MKGGGSDLSSLRAGPGKRNGGVRDILRVLYKGSRAIPRARLCCALPQIGSPGTVKRHGSCRRVHDHMRAPVRSALGILELGSTSTSTSSLRLHSESLRPARFASCCCPLAMGKKDRQRPTGAASNGPSKRPKLAAPPAAARERQDDVVPPGQKRPPPLSAKPVKSALKGGRNAAAAAAVAGAQTTNGGAVKAKAPEVKAAAPTQKKEVDQVDGTAQVEELDVAGPRKDKATVEKAAKASKGKAKAPPATISTPAAAPFTSFKFVFGTYERLLYGLHCNLDSTPPSLVPLFSFPAHLGPLRTVTASPSGKHLLTSDASSSALSLWALRTRRESGTLLGPNETSSITAVEFDRAGKVVCVANEEGEVTVYRTKDWVMLRRLKGHTGRINGVGIHPDGRVMMSVGKDRCLRMWDLGGGATGKAKEGGSQSRPVASVRLGVEGDLVRWSGKGTRLGVVTGGTVTVYDTVRPFSISARQVLLSHG